MVEQAKVVVFAGTTEGRRLGEYLSQREVPVILSVATDYGEEVLEPLPYQRVLSQRLNPDEMAELLKTEGLPLVIDATHPYAKEVTVNIKKACETAGAEYIRLVREQWEYDDIYAADSVDGAAQLLNEHGGRVLLTVGSKELEAFTQVDDWQQRIFARVLPAVDVVEKCTALGFSGKHMICMQGPFTHELNVAMIRALEIDWLVSKDSGDAGGFYEKLSAVRETGIKLLLIRRPLNEEGLSFREVVKLLRERFDLAELDEALSARFPLFVKLSGKKVAVVGGGKIAARRVQVLLDFGAHVTVIAPELSDTLRILAQDGTIEWQARAYQDGDLDGAVIALAATDDHKVNLQAADEAERRSIPISVASDKEAGSFWFPATLRQNGIVAGVISAKAEHHAAKHAAAKIREVLLDERKTAQGGKQGK